MSHSKNFLVFQLAAISVSAVLCMAGPVRADETTGTITTGGGVTTGVGGTVVAPPTARPGAGTYTSNQAVALSAPGASSIHYVTNGDALSCTGGSAYGSAIPVSAGITIRAVACYPNSQSSAATSFAYVLRCPVPSVSDGSVSDYPACAVACNPGYVLSGGGCVAAAGAAGGNASVNVGGGGGYAAPTFAPVASSTAPVTSAPSGTSRAAQLQLLNSLIAQLQALLRQAQAQGIALPAGATQFLAGPAATDFPRNLQPGMTGKDVRSLQQFLVAQNTGPAARALAKHGATNAFGMLTENALIEFQKKAGIRPASGYFGPKTRAYVSSLAQ
ncbi:MAG: peptidoglycan-binding protein [Bryobacteraceae bacterium]|jgi:hypothetical protein